MADVELVSCKITKLTMVNNISASETLQLENVRDFDVRYKQDNRVAVAVLSVKVRHRQNPDIFCIALELQGIFRLNGFNNVVSKKEAHIKCYDALFPYADQIVTYLTVNSGMPCFRLQKIPLNPESINFGPKPNSVSSEKIIELKLDV